MKARVSQLHKTAAEWAKFANWVPEAGEFIIYDPDNEFEYARVKVGDGRTNLQTLPFFIESAIIEQMLQHRYNEIIDAGRIK